MFYIGLRLRTKVGLFYFLKLIGELFTTCLITQKHLKVLCKALHIYFFMLNVLGDFSEDGVKSLLIILYYPAALVKV